MIAFVSELSEKAKLTIGDVKNGIGKIYVIDLDSTFLHAVQRIISILLSVLKLCFELS